MMWIRQSQQPGHSDGPGMTYKHRKNLRRYEGNQRELERRRQRAEADQLAEARQAEQENQRLEQLRARQAARRRGLRGPLPRS